MAMLLWELRIRSISDGKNYGGVVRKVAVKQIRRRWRGRGGGWRRAACFKLRKVQDKARWPWIMRRCSDITLAAQQSWTKVVAGGAGAGEKDMRSGDNEDRRRVRGGGKGEEKGGGGERLGMRVGCWGMREGVSE